MSEFNPYGLFYDASSGEFFPPTDPGRAHTLARLAAATCERGEQGVLEEFIYRPLWARDSICVVEQPFFPGDYDTLVAIGREGEPPAVIVEDHVSNPTEFPRRHSLVTVTPEIEIVHPLELGPELARAREAVAAAAQSFYDTLES